MDPFYNGKSPEPTMPPRRLNASYFEPEPTEDNYLPEILRSNQAVNPMERYKYLTTINKNTKIDVAKRIIKDMRTKGNSNSTTFMMKCLKGIRILVYKDKREEKLLIYGLGPVLLTCVRKFPKNGDIVEMVLGIVKHLGGNLTCLLKMGFIGDIMSCMAMFAKNDVVQEQGCLAITNLSFCPSIANYLVKMKIGGLLLKAVTHHQGKPLVCTAACKAVWYFCRYEHAEAMWTHNLGPELIKLMKTHPREEKLQEYACGAIDAMGHYYAMLRLGAADGLVSALNHHNKNKKLVGLACAGIRHYATLKRNITVLLKTNRLITVIINTMLNHLQEPKIQECCNLVFWCFGLSDEGKGFLMNAGVATAVVETIRVNVKDAKVVSTGCGTLTNLSTSGEHAEQLFTLNAEEIVMRGLFYHEKDEDVIFKGLCALRNLMHYNNKRITQRHREQAAQIANNATNRYTHNSKLLEYARDILNSLS